MDNETPSETELKKAGPRPPFPEGTDVSGELRNPNRRPHPRLVGCIAFSTVLALVFLKPLASLAMHAAGSQLHSHILLVPFISAYLVYIRRKQLPAEFGFSPGWAGVPLLAGVAALALGWGSGAMDWHLSENDSLALMALSFVCLLVAGGFVFLGKKWMSAVAFPVAFLIFMVPLPDGVVDWLETGSKLASADAANMLFHISGTPVFREGTVFHLPGMVVEVAQECSGIRSSLVLFITGLLASNLLLRSGWRRALLVAVVIPLGILRNGFRVLVISLLCVHIGPHMIHSSIHRRGGPVFFVLSLVPLFLLLWWLRRGDAAAWARENSEGVAQG